MRLEYEAHTSMAEAEMTRIVEEVAAEHGSIDIALEHRIGLLDVGDIAVAIACATPHRAESFAACRTIIEELKKRVPIWKKEVFSDGAAWVANRP